MGNGACKSCMFTHSARAATNNFRATARRPSTLAEPGAASALAEPGTQISIGQPGLPHASRISLSSSQHACLSSSGGKSKCPRKQCAKVRQEILSGVLLCRSSLFPILDLTPTPLRSLTAASSADSVDACTCFATLNSVTTLSQKVAMMFATLSCGRTNDSADVTSTSMVPCWVSKSTTTLSMRGEPTIHQAICVCISPPALHSKEA